MPGRSRRFHTANICGRSFFLSSRAFPMSLQLGSRTWWWHLEIPHVGRCFRQLTLEASEVPLHRRMDVEAEKVLEFWRNYQWKPGDSLRIRLPNNYSISKSSQPTTPPGSSASGPGDRL